MLENGTVRTFDINPEDIGISRSKPEVLKGGDPQANAAAREHTLEVYADIVTRYRVAGVRAYDMFPQTAHVETVCELVPEAA